MGTQINAFSGERLRKIRLEHGISQSNLALLLHGVGVLKTASPVRISAWECGYQTPGADRLIALARVLGVSPEDFYE